MPALTHFYGLRPWEVEHMTFGEVDEYLRQYEVYVRETNKPRR